MVKRDIPVRFATTLAMIVMFVAPVAAQRPLDVPYVPTPHEVVRAMLEVAKVDSTDVVYDLGSGDGRIVIAAATRFGARGLGVDLNPERVADAMRNAQQAGVQDRAVFRQQDLFELDLSPATVVTLYLLSDVNLRLRPRLFEQLRPGTRVVSHAFGMRDWEPDSLMWVPYNGSRARVYYWVIPERVSGAWMLERDGASASRLMLLQRHQRLDGSLEVGEQAVQISDARMRGDSITFTLVRQQGGNEVREEYVGRVQGDRMEGTINGTARRWSARRSQG